MEDRCLWGGGEMENSYTVWRTWKWCTHLKMLSIKAEHIWEFPQKLRIWFSYELKVLFLCICQSERDILSSFFPSCLLCFLFFHFFLFPLPLYIFISSLFLPLLSLSPSPSFSARAEDWTQRGSHMQQKYSAAGLQPSTPLYAWKILTC